MGGKETKQSEEEFHPMVTVGGGLGKISESIQLAESKKNNVEKSILSLLFHWKELEDGLESAQKDFDQGLRELDSKEDKLNCEKERLESSRVWMEETIRDIWIREKDFELFRKKKMKDLERREREFERIRDAYDKSVCEPLGEQEKKVEGLLEKIKLEKLEIEKRLREIELEEEATKNRRKEVEMIEICIEKRTRELKHKEGKVRERERQAELKEEQLNLLKERQIEIESKESQLQLTIEDLEFQEKHIVFIRNLNEKRMVELDLKEKEIESEKEMLEKGLKDLESQREGFSEQIKEVKLREKELELSLSEFHSKNKDLLLQKQLHEEGTKKLLQEKKEFEHRVKQFELAKIELEKSLKEFDLEKKQSFARTQLLEIESKELESKWIEYERKSEELNSREKELEKSFHDQRKELEDRTKKFELKEKELGLNEKKVESEKELLEKESKSLESRRKELEHRIKNFELRCKELEFREEKLESRKKSIEEDSLTLESRRKKLEETIRKLELREKQLNLKEKQLSGGAAHAHPKTELSSDPVIQILSSNDIDLRSVALMKGGKDLQIFLNEREKDHHSMAGEITMALQLSKDPARLVLDAMDGFFPPHLDKGSGEFSSDVVRRSCMLLLQQLIKISPQIQPCVRDNALELAREWKAKLSVDCLLQVFGFLYLLGTYNLASAFDSEEIMPFLKTISKHQEKLEPELCGRLGLREKIPSVIKNLLKSNQSLEAIKFIYGFELVNIFPPVPILKNYLKHVKMHAHTMLRNRREKKNAQDEFVDTRIAALRSVIKCIVNYRLESEYSIKDLENSIKQLLKQRKNKEIIGSSYSNVEAKHILSTAPSNQPKVQSCASSSQPKAQSSALDLSDITGGPSHSMAVIITNMDGKMLLGFLSSYWSEHEVLHNEILSALQNSCNLPKLVLDAVEELFHSTPTEEKSKSCIFLLEQLLVLSPDIMPRMKETAQSIAFDLQMKLKARNGNSLLTLAYLLLIGAYRLDSTLHRDELLELYQMVTELKPSPLLAEALGISKDIFSAAPLQSRLETQKDTPRCTLADNSMPSTSMVPGLEGQESSLCANKDLEGKECVSVHSEVPTFINLSFKPADLVLGALIYCHQSEVSGNKCPELLAKNIYHLLEHLTAVSPEIKPDIKDRAHKFYISWTAKPIGARMWETLGRLQLIAAYQLSSYLSSDQIFCLLEVVHPPKKVASFIRMLNLVDKVPDFISKLNQKKKLLVSFALVYEFKLAATFPPVAFLKQFVRYSKVAAKKIFFKGHKSMEAREKSIEFEISALNNAIRRITNYKLESEYPPDELRSKIKDLEIERANLKKNQMQKWKMDPEIQVNNKRHWPISDSINESATNSQPASKFRRLNSKSCPQFPNHHSHQIQYHQMPPLPQHPPGDIGSNTDLYAQSYLRKTPGGHHPGFSGLTPLPSQTEFLLSNNNAKVPNFIPALFLDSKETFNTGRRKT